MCRVVLQPLEVVSCYRWVDVKDPEGGTLKSVKEPTGEGFRAFQLQALELGSISSQCVAKSDCVVGVTYSKAPDS